jgi:cell division protein FtsW (lipid II flippase)
MIVAAGLIFCNRYYLAFGAAIVCFFACLAIFFMATFSTSTVAGLVIVGAFAAGVAAMAPDASNDVARVAARIDFNILNVLFDSVTSPTIRSQKCIRQMGFAIELSDCH